MAGPVAGLNRVEWAMYFTMAGTYFSFSQFIPGKVEATGLPPGTGNRFILCLPEEHARWRRLLFASSRFVGIILRIIMIADLIQ
jgi:hypothetical protein